MIRVVKPAAPAVLAKGVALTAAHEAAYDLTPGPYQSGDKTFSFKKSVYGPEIVKATLKAAQHHKCCFCEARFAANYAGDVEHYRPKGAVKQTNGKLRPGYYWLAYVWTNLYYACADCNQYRKIDQFPLSVEAARARNHHDPIAAEAPLILDPGGPDDPRKHIVFKGDVPFWTSPEGEATVRILKLDRIELNQARRSHLESLGLLSDAASALEALGDPAAGQLIQRIRSKLAAAVKPDAVYSAAAQDYFAEKF
ncbi:MAG: hypothetical protein ACREEB_18510 [Caulobacteraceae bacterium]